ncbi:MAG: hypothetical protein WDM76_06730 [Limisphaerales bacterium]
MATLTNGVTLAPSSLSKVVASETIANPHLWNGLADPYLYRAFVEVRDGAEVLDMVEQPLGFRSFSIDPNKGFFSTEIITTCMA